MSSGSAAHTASTPSSRRERPAAVTRLRRIQPAAVWASRRAAPGASHGASVGTVRASLLSFRWARSTSSRTSGLIRGIAPR
jgi:hypothetical protein